MVCGPHQSSAGFCFCRDSLPSRRYHQSVSTEYTPVSVPTHCQGQWVACLLCFDFGLESLHHRTAADIGGRVSYLKSAPFTDQVLLRMMYLLQVARSGWQKGVRSEMISFFFFDLEKRCWLVLWLVASNIFRQWFRAFFLCVPPHVAAGLWGSLRGGSRQFSFVARKIQKMPFCIVLH